jgi:hypothetical protein
MRISEVTLTEAPLRTISKQAALDRGFYGPLYHGTTDENRATIAQQGFKVSNVDDVANRNGFGGKFNAGYPGIPPVHLLGYGVYFTTVKAVAKQYNQNSMRGIIEYYIDAPRMGEIGFQSPNTIWKWWVQNGYNFDPKIAALKDNPANMYAGNRQVMQEQLRATQNMTRTLAAQFDAIHLKKSLYRRGVDDEQVVVFDPNRIYQIDAKMAGGWDVGAVVTHNQRVHYSPEFIQKYDLTVEKQPNGWTWVTRGWDDGRRTPLIQIPPPGMTGIIMGKREIPQQYRAAGGIDPRMANQSSHWVDVKWKKGGVMHNYVEAELDPAKPVQERAD